MDSLPARTINPPRQGPTTKPSKGGIPLLVSIILANFANGLLIASWIPSNAVSWFYAVIPLGIALLLITLLFRKVITPHSELAVLSAFVCASIVIVMALPSSTPLLASLIFAAFWLLFAFSLSVATWVGAWKGEAGSRIASLCMGCVVVGTFSSRVIGTFVDMQAMAYLVIAAVLLAFSLALALVSGNASASAYAEGPATFDSSDACRAIAREKDLTERECDVFLLLAKGYSLKSIAEKLYVSENTVKSHRRRIYLKLDVNSRQELIDLVEESGEALL